MIPHSTQGPLLFYKLGLMNMGSTLHGSCTVAVHAVTRLEVASVWVC